MTLDLAPAGDRLRALLDLPLTSAQATALLLARGPAFQRWEWLGDSVLDVLIALNRLEHDSFRPRSGASPRGHHVLASDAALAKHSRGHTLWDVVGDVVAAPLSPGRRADLVEVVLGLAHAHGDWPAARRAAGDLVHPELGAVRLPPESAAPPADWLTHRVPTPGDHEPEEELRRGIHLGTYLLEAAASLLLFSAHPGADPGELSALRGDLLGAEHLVGSAVRLTGDESLRRPPVLPWQRGTQEAALDQVQAAVGAVGLACGLGHGLAAATTLLNGP